MLSGLMGEPADTPRLPPRTGVLQSRGNRLAELAEGQSVARMHEIVDPARCRVWDAHNRDYDALNDSNCADLIESFRAQGRQEVPAIVRRVKGDANIDFEIICGARRHWTVSWMRANGHPTFGFLVEPRELNDEEAFRVSDLENRSRRDLSDIERARDYLRAVERFYDGDQRKMAQRLKVTDTWLSRYLELARLPPGVYAAFGSPHDLGISHAAQLAPLIRSSRTHDAVLSEAALLAHEQQARRETGEQTLPAAAVMQRLKAAIAPKARPRSVPTTHVVRNAAGEVIAKGQRAARGGIVTVSFPNVGKPTLEELASASLEILKLVKRVAD